jgi:hypothetical protein
LYDGDKKRQLSEPTGQCQTLFHNHLLSEGVDESRIIEVDLEDRTNKELRDPRY